MSCGNVKKVFVPNKKPEETPQPVSSGLVITDRAAEKIKHFITTSNKQTTEWGLKISVVADGCSGKSYTMDLSELKQAQQDEDKIFEKDGAYVMVPKTSYLFVTGSTLDYTESLLASGFNLSNPNVKKTCSCGSSFAI